MKEKQPIIILGSARKQSDTRRLLDRLFSDVHYPIIDLLDYTIYPYDYEANYPADDDFINIIEKIFTYDVIIFATPVYWYAMSAQMKIFFDRLTDLVTIQKSFGRRLKGKSSFLIAIGTDETLPEGFEIPFRLTSEYFDMNFIMSYYCQVNNLTTSLQDAKIIIEQIKASVK